MLWWELINEAEAFSESAHLGLASVWGPIHRGDYRRARAELDRAVDYWTDVRLRPRRAGRSAMAAATHLDAWAERSAVHGLTRVGDGRCPRHLAGKEHRGADCWCTSRLNDHAATYVRDGTRLIAWEPYDADGVHLAEVIAEATADGLDVTVSGWSGWNPGHTFALWFAAREAVR